MTALARAIGIRSLHVSAAAAHDFATAYALLLALHVALVALSLDEKLAYLGWIANELEPAIPVVEAAQPRVVTEADGN